MKDEKLRTWALFVWSTFNEDEAVENMNKAIAERDREIEEWLEGKGVMSGKQLANELRVDNPDPSDKLDGE